MVCHLPRPLPEPQDPSSDKGPTGHGLSSDRGLVCRASSLGHRRVVLARNNLVKDRRKADLDRSSSGNARTADRAIHLDRPRLVIRALVPAPVVLIINSSVMAPKAALARSVVIIKTVLVISSSGLARNRKADMSRKTA